MNVQEGVLTAELAACAMLARIAWPFENDDCQARWAHKVATDPEIGGNVYRRALEKSHGDAGLRFHVEASADVLRKRGATHLVGK